MTTDLDHRNHAPGPWRMLAAALALTLVALLLAACGGGDDDDGTAAASGGSASGEATTENDQDAARVRLQDCLREQGIDLPAPGEGDAPGAVTADLDTEKLREAFEGPCKEEQEAAFGGFDAEDRQELQDQLTRFTDCLRDQGLDVPDVRVDEMIPRDGELLDQDDPEVQAATKACQDELPAGAGGTGAGR